MTAKTETAEELWRRLEENVKAPVYLGQHLETLRLAKAFAEALARERALATLDAVFGCDWNVRLEHQFALGSYLTILEREALAARARILKETSDDTN